MAPIPLLIGSAVRPYPTEDVSGDVWHVDWRPAGCRIAVIDGLGHGPAAAAAATTARDALAASPDDPPDEALRRCHAALHGTRGAAIAIAAIDLSTARLTFAGVGNVAGRHHGAGRMQHVVSSRGIVGAMLPTIRPVVVELAADWILILHTDGVSDRFDLGDLGDAIDLDAQPLANFILARWGRATDDACVVVARGVRSGPGSGSMR